jgi:type II secretory pathway pseudopilin PulG
MNKKGFTLFEILLVLLIIFLIFSITLQIFNFSEYFKKSRDLKRISDMQILNNTFNLYLNLIESPSLGPSNTSINEATPTIFISIPFDKENIRNLTISSGSQTFYFSQVSSTEYFKNNGEGWLPVNFTILPNVPLSILPVDPINSYSQKLFYSYIFKRSSSTYEINTKLESKNYNYLGKEDKTSTDNGDNIYLLEIGNDKTLMPNNLY